MIDAFCTGVLAMYIISGAVVLATACYRKQSRPKFRDIGFVIGTILVWPLFVDHLFKKL